jgi:hypothetical protein
MAVKVACREAIDRGVRSAPVILGMLARPRDPTPPLLLLPPTARRLIHEPVADGASDLLVLWDHASPRRPGRLAHPGLPQSERLRHIGQDIGALSPARAVGTAGRAAVR